MTKEKAQKGKQRSTKKTKDRVTRTPLRLFQKCILLKSHIRGRLCKLQKGCTRLAAASDKVYQLLAHGRWFSPGTPASSTTKTGRHEIAEILLKVELSTINQIKSKKDFRLLYPGCYKLMFYDTDYK